MLKFLPAFVCVSPLRHGAKKTTGSKLYSLDVASAHFHFHMWECVDMKQQSLSVLSIQHEK